MEMVTNQLLDRVYSHHAHRVTQGNHNILSPVKLQTYVDAIVSKGSALANCFGFVDGTVWPITRPGANQCIVYNGHKRVHALKFQIVALPNGLTGNLYGLVKVREKIYLLTICLPIHHLFMSSFSLFRKNLSCCYYYNYYC